MKKLLGILIVFFLIMALTKGVSARCEQQYGGGETCYEGELRLDKVVKNPSNGTYVDNLFSSDPNFSADQEVWFKLNIKNTGSDDLNDVEVKDKFPNYVFFVSGTGNWNDTDKTLSWKIDHLSPGESKDYEIKGKIVSEGSLPNDSGTYCVTNYGEAKKDDKSASDTSQLCVSKKVLGMAVMPPTGSNLILTILLLVTFLSFGIIFRKQFLKSDFRA